MKKAPIFLFTISSLIFFSSLAQPLAHVYEIAWENPVTNKITDNYSVSLFYFMDAMYDVEKGYLPYLLINHPLKNGTEISSASITILETKDIDYDVKNIKGIEQISSDFEISYGTGYYRKMPQGSIQVYPLRKNAQTGKIEALTKFSLQVQEKKVFSQSATQKNKPTSVLSEGEWYKLAISSDGVYKLTYHFLASNNLNPKEIDPKNIRLFAGQPGQLPEPNTTPRIDDLEELSIYVHGENDGIFDKNDYILFYGKSPHTWVLDTNTNRFVHKTHLFSDTSYYFLTFTNGAGKRISNQSSHTNTPTHYVSSFNDYAHYEKDFLNLIKSGRIWLGETFDIINEYTFAFNFPSLVNGSNVHLSTQVFSRSADNASFTYTIGNNNFNIPVQNISGGLNCYYCEFANPASSSFQFNANSPLINIKAKYNKLSAQDKSWLDYITLNVRRQLNMTGKSMFFRDNNSVGIGNIAEYALTGVNNATEIWEVTDPFNVKRQNGNSSGSTFTFRLQADFLREFVAFNEGDTTGIKYLGKVLNQNLHAQPQAELIVVAHPAFYAAAFDLAMYRKAQGISVNIASTTEIYNEFSGGVPDIVAVRDYLRMFYNRAQNQTEMPRYLLLFGDGSYDNKNRIKNNTNFILTYQSVNSTSPLNSYVSDDYYGLLDNNEGTWNPSNNDIADVGIGRLPAKTPDEAFAMVKKIKHYELPSTMRDWRNIISFVADDEDINTHMTQADQLSAIIDTAHKAYNIEKIYFDAYKQESTPGGQRYPDVNRLINERADKGALIMNYTGHGGEIGWAHERVLGIPDIKSWNNLDNMPLFFTATCEFSRFDDPERTSAGELIMLSPNGAGIGLLTTVRLVYSSPNLLLNQSFYNNVFSPINGEMPRMGDVFRLVKASQGQSINTRNFTLLGDPSTRLAYPYHLVETIEINGKPAMQGDTIKALSKVTIKGFVKDKSGQKLANFNGIIYPTIFDKKSDINTLNNDNNGVFSFKVRNSKLFKGKASVKNGDFTFSFIVPKDIAYSYGSGRASYYAENGEQDAHGFYEGFTVGGTADNYAADTEGPNMKLYMNEPGFVFGGITDENPIFFADIFDEHGINMTGNGVGHDITAILDGNVNDVLILNDFYEAELDSYQKGKIKYPLKNLAEGKHTITLKVWDVYNNSSEISLDFTVVKNKDIALEKVLNYPNPFTTYTEFWFEHNQAGRTLNTQIQIFTISGKLVKTLKQDMFAEGYRQSSITWDGLDDFGDRLARGVYIYKLKVRSSNGTIAEKYEKLVIL